MTEILPSLIPIVTKEDWCRSLQGLSLKNVKLSAKAGKKLLFDELGEMLSVSYTHLDVYKRQSFTRARRESSPRGWM